MRLPAEIAPAWRRLRHTSAAQSLARTAGAAAWVGAALSLAAGRGGAMAVLLVLVALAALSPDSVVAALAPGALVGARLLWWEVPGDAAAWLVLAAQAAALVLGHAALAAAASWPTSAPVPRPVAAAWAQRLTAALALSLGVTAAAVPITRAAAALAPDLARLLLLGVLLGPPTVAAVALARARH